MHKTNDDEIWQLCKLDAGGGPEPDYQLEWPYMFLTLCLHRLPFSWVPRGIPLIELRYDLAKTCKKLILLFQPFAGL